MPTKFAFYHDGGRVSSEVHGTQGPEAHHAELTGRAGPREQARLRLCKLQYEQVAQDSSTHTSPNSRLPDIKCAAANIKHQHGVAVCAAVDAVGQRRRHRLLQQLHLAKARLPRSGVRGALLLLLEVRWHGDHLPGRRGGSGGTSSSLGSWGSGAAGTAAAACSQAWLPSVHPSAAGTAACAPTQRLHRPCVARLERVAQPHRASHRLPKLLLRQLAQVLQHIAGQLLWRQRLVQGGAAHMAGGRGSAREAARRRSSLLLRASCFRSASGWSKWAFSPCLTVVKAARLCHL